MADVFPLHQRAHPYAVHHAARPQKGLQVHQPNRLALWVVVQWRIGVRTDVRRQGDTRQVDRAAVRQRGRPLLLVRRITGEHGRTLEHGGRNVPDAPGGVCHGVPVEVGCQMKWW